MANKSTVEYVAVNINKNGITSAMLNHGGFIHRCSRVANVETHDSHYLFVFVSECKLS